MLFQTTMTDYDIGYPKHTKGFNEDTVKSPIIMEMKMTTEEIYCIQQAREVLSKIAEDRPEGWCSVLIKHLDEIVEKANKVFVNQK